MSNFHIERMFEGEEIVNALYDGDTYWMDDGLEETAIHQQVADKCKGRVLVGGLGLGLIVNMLLWNEHVTQIVVVEKEQAVFDLVKTRLLVNWNLEYTERIKFKIMDIETYLRKTTQEFDYVYLDIVPVATAKSYATISLPLKILAQRIAPLSNIICYEEVKGIE